jgi:hypothetical protein
MARHMPVIRRRLGKRNRKLKGRLGWRPIVLFAGLGALSAALVIHAEGWW